MKRNSKKTLTKILSFGLIFSNILPVFAYDTPTDENGYSSEVVEYQNTTDEDFSNVTNVFAQLKSVYNVTIPKAVILSGATKDAKYYVKVEGDIAGYETLHVVPDNNFNLYTKNKNSQTTTIQQDKTAWKYDNFNVDANGHIDANNITAGKWKGTFNFNIFLTNEEDAKLSALDNIVIPDELDANYRLTLSKLQTPGIYDENANLIASYDKLEEEGFNIQLDDGSSANLINNNYSQTSFIVLPNTITSIGANALRNTNVEFVYIPDSVTLIDDYAFADTKIVSSTIPESVTFVSDTAFKNTPAVLNSTIADKTNSSSQNNPKNNYSNLIIRTININLENKDEVTINLERGYRYQIKALYGYYNNVTKQSTITVDDENIVKFVPDCYIDALETGKTVIRGTYTTKSGIQKNAKINVCVKHTHTRGKKEIENRIEPTCAEEGSYEIVYYCKTCGEEVARTKQRLFKTKHVSGEPTKVIILEPTCLENGKYKELIHCVNCSKKLSETTKISEKLGHNFINDICTRCGRKKEYVAGLYDEKGTLIYSWDELEDIGVDITNNASNGNKINSKLTKDKIAYNSLTLIMSSKIKEIHKSALSAQSTGKISKVVIPDSVTTLQTQAFHRCSGLETLIIGNSVKELPVELARESHQLKEIIIGNSVEIINNNAFRQTSLTSIEMPNSVKTIGRTAFADCTSLESATLSNSLTAIGIGTFSNCDSLKSITIPDSVTNIDENTFYNCKSLSSVTLGNSVKTIGNKAFNLCSSLDAITLPESVTKIGNYCFAGCSIKTAKLPNSLKTIGDSAFYNCQSLTFVKLPDNVEIIGQYAFRGCTSLASVEYRGVIYTNQTELLKALNANKVKCGGSCFGKFVNS